VLVHLHVHLSVFDPDSKCLTALKRAHFLGIDRSHTSRGVAWSIVTRKRTVLSLRSENLRLRFSSLYFICFLIGLTALHSPPATKMYRVDPFPGHDVEIVLPTTMYKMNRLVPEYYNGGKVRVSVTFSRRSIAISFNHRGFPYGYQPIHHLTPSMSCQMNVCVLQKSSDPWVLLEQRQNAVLKDLAELQKQLEAFGAKPAASSAVCSPAFPALTSISLLLLCILEVGWWICDNSSKLTFVVSS
jgi:hypothetical protein